jgi:DNA-binding Xre family transcriptional regulator
MLKIDIKRIAMKKGQFEPTKLLVKHGFEKQKAWRIVSGRVKDWDLKDIEKLCEIFVCSPNDLFVLVPEKGKVYDSKHPMQPLTRENEPKDIVSFLRSASIEEIEEFEAEMKRRKEGEK